MYTNALVNFLIENNIHNVYSFHNEQEKCTFNA